MEWVLIGAIVLVLAAVGVALLLRANRGGAAERDEEVDPLFVAGIAIAGAGAALLSTLPAASVVMFGVGLVLMVVGITRTRRRGDG
jgi:hypothetical protein